MYLAGRWRFNLLWNPGSKGRWTYPRAASFAFIGSRVLLFLHVLGLIVFSSRIVPPEYKLDATPGALFGTVVLAMALDALLAWHRVKRERRAARDTSKIHLRHNLITELTISGVGVMLAFFVMGQFMKGFHVPLAFVWIIFILAQRFGFGANVKALPAPFDESPVLDELRAIGKPFGVRLKELKTKRARKNGSLFRMPLVELVKEQKPVHSMVLPWENFIYLDPATTTLSFALRWANEVRPGTVAALLRRNMVVMFIFIVATMAAWVFMFYLAIQYIAPMVRAQGGSGAAMAIVLAVVAPLAVVIVAGKLLGFYPSRRRAIRNAFEAWKDAERWEKRDLVDFVTAAAQYNAYQNQIFVSEVALLQIRRNHRIRLLLRQMGVTDTEQIFAQVAQKLTFPFMRAEEAEAPRVAGTDRPAAAVSADEGKASREADKKLS